MQRVLFLLLAALFATSALAAPFRKPTAKHGSFAVPVKGRHGRHGHQLSPLKEMHRIYAKYNWELASSLTEPLTSTDNSKPIDINYGLGELGLGGLLDPSTTSGSQSSSTDSGFGALGLDPLGGSQGSGGSSIAGLGLDPLESGIMSVIDPLISSAPTPAPTQTAIADQPKGPFTSTGAIGNATTTTLAAASSAAGGADTSEVTASPEANDSEYLVPVTIGGQTMNLDFDTGSADLWVFSTELPSNEVGSHTTFDKSKSTTWKDYQGGAWKITYGDSSGASGNVGFDNVAVGAATATGQAVELATSVSSQFVSDTDNDGLLGLAFSNINTVTPKKQQTWFDTIKSDLAMPVFTADLEKDASGTYEFGKIDSSKYTGDVHYTPVDSSGGFWQFDSKTYTIGGKSHACTTCSAAIADTGTSLILVDDDVAAAYYAQVQGSKNDASQGGYTYPCSNTLPDFGIAIGDYVATLKGDGLTYANVDSSTCFGGVQGNGGSGMQIFGDVMFKQYFAIFDGGKTQFGVASKA